ncbi:hypothetical protein CFN78_13255 [Amycolatopsis antarctica]|uniref:Uncharacterized protein n=1 Tax=Amycolatopsis antarctica TaxID=1854586 RepID=A0A263D558_9PSEU|nr:hypothetical protein [Amycolatopsis antarctica]OZM72606.1 hypothetical protein CFN78_13255 [Amycolatopsis antarctica]
MLTPEQYLGVVAERVQRTGGRVYGVPFGPVTALVGLFTESVMMSTINYCVFAAPWPEVNASTLHQFTGHATQHARANVVGTVGWTASSVVIAGLVGNRVLPDGAAAAMAKPGNQLAAETRMVAVDVGAGQVHMFRGSRFWGAAMQGSINARTHFAFPEPAEVYEQLRWQAWQRGPGTPPPGMPPPRGFSL